MKKNRLEMPKADEEMLKEDKLENQEKDFHETKVRTADAYYDSKWKGTEE